ncbi:MAG: RNA 2',3'-cyclic phosphodiesterase [Kiritimatiellae bacterium]|nr:RNA 2',3'-cyclic phosphodiesterase [Kiritimatiellia bacterium]
MSCDDLIRAFIAVEINSDIKGKINLLQERFRLMGIRAGWVKSANMHLTLVFMGDINNEISNKVCTVMDTVASAEKPFFCEVRGLGYFGKRDKPRVVWADVTGDARFLVDVQNRIYTSIRPLGIQMDDRPFVPHLTIARIRSPVDVGKLVMGIEEHKEDYFGKFDVNNLILVKSELEADGPKYTILHRSVFRASGQAV